MAHEVETMAWTNTVPWHGLGQQVPQGITTDEMLRLAKIDWTVSKRPLFIGDWTTSADGTRVASNNADSELCTDAYALVRDSDNKVLDVVGRAYTPVQNHQAMGFFREFVEGGKAYIDTAGSLRGGKIVWVLASLNKSFKLAGKDEVKGYLMMSSPHQQGKAQIMKFTSIRVVCNNTLTAALRSDKKSELRRAHRAEFDAAAQDKAKDALGIARDQFEEFAEFSLKLSKTKVDPLQAARLIAQAFGDEDLADAESIELVRKEGSKGTVIALDALEKAPGAKLLSADGTAWGVLNAVTYTTDHSLRNSADSRLFHAWFGRSAGIKDRATELVGALI